MDISQRTLTFNCDETPTPTRFIRNCEEVGLFQDIQDNPFEETFRIAVQTKRTTQTLPEPLSKSVNNSDTLDTPQVVPNSKRIEDYRNSYPIIEDDDDEIKLPNSDFLITKYMTQDENSLSNDEIPLENLPLVQHIQMIENQNNEQITSQVDQPMQNNIQIENQNNEQITTQVDQPDKNVIDLTESPVQEQTFNIEPESAQNEFIEEIFLENHEIMTDDSITNEFLMLNNKTDAKENTYSSTSLIVEKITVFPSKAKSTSQSIEAASSSVKQKLKKLLKPTQNITQPIPKIIQPVIPAPTRTPSVSGGEISDDKLSYSRERNRMAQKRCRLKKKEWISRLKQDTESVYSENKNLRSEIVSLKAEVAHLKTLLLAHKNCPVTLAMYQADLSNVVQNDPPIPQISALSTNAAGTPIPYGIISATKAQKLQAIESKANHNKKVILKSKKVPVPKLNPIRTSNPVTKSNPAEKKQSLKVIIDKNPTMIPQPIVNSPNAVNVICYNQNQPIIEIANLAYNGS